MTLLNISEYWQLVVRGALILSAVLIKRINSRREWLQIELSATGFINKFSQAQGAYDG